MNRRVEFAIVFVALALLVLIILSNPPKVKEWHNADSWSINLQTTSAAIMAPAPFDWTPWLTILSAFISSSPLLAKTIDALVKYIRSRIEKRGLQKIYKNVVVATERRF